MHTDVAERIARRNAVLDRVRRTLIESLMLELEPEDIDPDVPLFGTGLALDSVDAVELVIAIDQAFGVDVAQHGGGVRSLRTVNTLIDVLLAAREDLQ